MKAFAIAVAVAVGLGLVAALVLTSSQRLAYQAYATSGARVSEPGTNLVGPAWNGDVREDGTPDRVHGTASHPRRS